MMLRPYSPWLMLTAILMRAYCLEARDIAIGGDRAVSGLGGRLVGAVKWQASQHGPGFLAGGGARIEVPTAAALDLRRGSVDLWCRPSWSPDDGRRHTFFHLGDSNHHVTLFKLERGAIRFVYKAAPEHFLNCDLNIENWQPGQWHHLTVSWACGAGQRMLIVLRVDDEQRSAFGGHLLGDIPTTVFIGTRGGSLQPADAMLAAVRFTDQVLLSSPFAAGALTPLDVTIDASKPGKPLPRIHDCTTIWNNRDNPVPFDEKSPEFSRFVEGGFRMARLVAFSENWLWGVKIGRDPQRRIQLDFTDFDRLVRVIRSAGAEVYLRLAYHMPKALSSKPDDPSWAYCMPRDLNEWDALMEAIVRHCLDNDFGIRYYVASLNEGDIAVGKHGANWEDICALYDRTARLVKRLDPNAKVGGPALALDVRTLGGPSMRRFLRYCREHESPLDFLCFHGYRKPTPGDYEAMIEAVQQMVREEHPGLQPELFLDEWNLWLRGADQDSEYAAAYLAGCLHFFRRAGLTKASIVSFNHFLPTDSPARTVVEHSGPFDKDGSQAARFLPQTLSAGGVQRPCILAHAPSRIKGYTFGRYRVTIPADHPRLHCFTGIALQHPGMDGVGFRVVVRRGQEQTVVLDVDQRKPPWREHTVSLARYAGQTVELEFRTDPGRAPGASTVADWAVWGQPQLLTGPDGTPRVAFDFIDRIGDCTSGVGTDGYTFTYDDRTIARYVGLPLIKGRVVTTPYFTFKMYHLLEGDMLPVALPGRDGITEDGAAGVTATRNGGAVRVLVWNFAPAAEGEREVRLHLRSLPDGPLQMTRYTIDGTHTNPYDLYIRRGVKPANGEYNLRSGDLDVVEQSMINAREGKATLRLGTERLSVELVVIRSLTASRDGDSID